MRGTALGKIKRSLENRFIPARAGNSFQTYPIKHRRTVHPRTCGEQSFPRGLDDKNYGSSPHVRGTDNALTDIIVISRFIPARAGNSNSLLLLIHSMAVHPRTCGEQSIHFSEPPVGLGSSPHVRGTVYNPSRNPLYFRFIPARAGNSLQSILPFVIPAVHPRTCGEQFLSSTA